MKTESLNNNLKINKYYIRLNTLKILPILVTFLYNLYTPLPAQYSDAWHKDSYQILKNLYKGELDYFSQIPIEDTILLNYACSELKLNLYKFKEALSILIDTSFVSSIKEKNFDTKSFEDSIKLEKANLEVSLQHSINNNSRIDALERLVSFPSLYDSLKSYTYILLPIYHKYLFKDKNFSDYIFKGIGLLNISEAEKELLIKESNTPIYVKAKLGDLNAIAEFQKRFVKAVSDTLYNKEIEILTNQLFYINSNILWDTFLFHLQQRYSQKYYFNCNNGSKCSREWSIAYILLKEYKKYFPFELEYFERSIFNNDRIPDDREIQVYFLAVSKYLELKFNQKITIKSYYFGRGD